MKKYLAILSAALMLFAGCNVDKGPRAKHVIFIVCDAMSAAGIQRTETPTFNQMIDGGALSLHTRCGLPSNSSPNWMTLGSATPFEMHGVLDNGVTPLSGTVVPALESRSGNGFYPTIFEFIREQRPDAKMYTIGQGLWMCGMYDMSCFDKVLPETGSQSIAEAFEKAGDAFVADKPELLFVPVTSPDHEGHVFGHENKGFFDTVHEIDSCCGKMLEKIKNAGLLDETVIVVTADHGGFNFGHGGSTMAELEVPVILYGGPVTKGKVMQRVNMNYDTPATVAQLLGVELPWECHGKYLKEAFEPSDGLCYVPLPLVWPYRGTVEAGGTVTITADAPDCEIYYTLDGSEPGPDALKYDGPFKLDSSCTVRAIATRGGFWGPSCSNFLYAGKPDESKAVKFRMWRGWTGKAVPTNYSRLGAPDAAGYASAFNLEELPFDVEEDDITVEFTSKLNIKEAGLYVFELTSDDGAVLYIDGKVAVDCNGSHPVKTKKGAMELSKGMHSIKVEYFDDSDGQNLFVNFGLDGQSLRPLCPEDLAR